MSSIQEYFDGKSVLITGGSGFMGKILVEKLLYSCPGVQNIYLLLRHKKGKSPKERIEEIINIMIFKRVREECPERFSKLVVINGDIACDGLGISDEDRKTLENNVDIVFHSAATLRLDTKLKEAINMNVTGTYRLLQLAVNMKKLKGFVHLSTAFCHVDYDVLEERIYPFIVDPKYIMELTQWMDDETFELLTPKLMYPHPNSYTYSKRLAEAVVNKFYPQLPVIILRPSIVCPTIEEPFPGWVDNLNGPSGILIGAGKGVIRSMLCHEEACAEVMPVDYAINAMLLITSTLSQKERVGEIPVFNVTQGKTHTVTWGEVLQVSRELNFQHPFEIMLWYPNGNIYRADAYGKFVHRLNVIFFHWIPAYLIDFIMVIINRKPFLVNIQRRIQDGLGMLQYFTTRQWVFKNDKLLEIRKYMNDEDKKIFSMDFESKEMKPYLLDCLFGIRHIFLKEDPASLPRSRRLIKIYWALDKLASIFGYLLLFWLIYQCFGLTKSGLDYVVSNLPETIPFFRTLTPAQTVPGPSITDNPDL